MKNMNRKLDKGTSNISLVILVIVCLIILMGSIYFLSKSEEKKEEVATPTKEVNIKHTANINISKKGFLPATLSVKKDTLVTFTNQDNSPHQPASDPHPSHDTLPGFDSKTKLQKNQTYSFLFDKEGTFTYHDEPNPLKFNGTIIVEK